MALKIDPLDGIDAQVSFDCMLIQHFSGITRLFGHTSISNGCRSGPVEDAATATGSEPDGGVTAGTGGVVTGLRGSGTGTGVTGAGADTDAETLDAPAC